MMAHLDLGAFLKGASVLYISNSREYSLNRWKQLGSPTPHGEKRSKAVGMGCPLLGRRFDVIIVELPWVRVPTSEEVDRAAEYLDHMGTKLELFSIGRFFIQQEEYEQPLIQQLSAGWRVVRFR